MGEVLTWTVYSAEYIDILLFICLTYRLLVMLWHKNEKNKIVNWQAMYVGAVGQMEVYLGFSRIHYGLRASFKFWCAYYVLQKPSIPFSILEKNDEQKQSLP